MHGYLRGAWQCLRGVVSIHLRGESITCEVMQCMATCVVAGNACVVLREITCVVKSITCEVMRCMATYRWWLATPAWRCVISPAW